ncbi:MAG: hypothetical protein A2474_03340 [Elusimicrobia bacterium RIFOXYC2_FULL_34_12]|nr:MAG: hypothetical protein A2474_03340 [Elusimicrobia bacterium RIFOXYC2_FULL_34_12]HAM37951.1 rubrerythrin [Elusimicrobiota bacterium]
MKKIDSLEFALNFEKKGTILYLDMARKNKNILSKQLFYSLASQEVDHAKKADDTYEILNKNIKDKSISLSKNLPSVELSLKEFFAKAKKIDLRKDVKNITGYELAMDMEITGYNAYRNFYKSTKNEIEIKLFEQLMAQEKEHLDSLRNVYYYLTDTGNWFEEEESKIWSWMNI